MGELIIRQASSRSDFDACVALQRDVWGLPDLEVSSAPQLIATTTLAGGLLQLAQTPAGDVVGFAWALPALRGGRPHLHSDMLAVLPGYQKQGVGVRLKWAQRQAALERGLDLITWTFDPLQARQANLNLRRLGGVATEFLPDVFGSALSKLHHGLPTDRLWVRWELHAPHVEALSREGEPARSVPAPELPRINEVRWQAGWPVSSDPDLGREEPELLLEVPPEWDVLCQSGPRVAADWHAKVRLALQTYFSRGYQAAALAPTEDSGRRRPVYVLRRS
jgi:predicted GNAT superfamily acetyltransferase